MMETSLELARQSFSSIPSLETGIVLTWKKFYGVVGLNSLVNKDKGVSLKNEVLSVAPSVHFGAGCTLFI